jgi:hypothetical protein
MFLGGAGENRTGDKTRLSLSNSRLTDLASPDNTFSVIGVKISRVFNNLRGLNAGSQNPAYRPVRHELLSDANLHRAFVLTRSGSDSWKSAQAELGSPSCSKDITLPLKQEGLKQVGFASLIF